MARKTRATGRFSPLIVLALVAVGVYALDQFSKFLVVANLTEGDVVRVLNEVLQLHFVRNPGAAFSLASGLTWIFSILATGVVVFIVWFAGRIRSIAWSVVFGLLLGGVLGNLTDRLAREPGFGLGHVVDFISTPWLIPAIYNVADMCIVSSMAIFMILTIRGIGLDGKRASASEASASEASASETSTSETSDMDTNDTGESAVRSEGTSETDASARTAGAADGVVKSASTRAAS